MNFKKLEVSELTLVASFRYALGRETYIVPEVVENILKNWILLSSKFKTKIKEEIQEAIKNNSAGSTIERWVKQLKDEDKIEFIGSKKTGGYIAK